MKRSIAYFFLVCCFVALTGCVSDNDIKALEDRITVLENEVAKQNQNNSEQSSSEIDGTTVREKNNEEDFGKEEAIDSESKSIDEEKSKDFTYVLDGLSANEIVEECMRCFDNLPKTGQTYENYQSSLRAVPLGTKDNYDIYYYFAQDRDFSDYPGMDAILYMYVGGVQTQMDGTIGFSDDSVNVRLELIIADYEKATEVYEQLYNRLALGYEDVQEKREGTSWIANGYFWDKAHSSGVGEAFVQLGKANGYYHLIATKYSYVD